MWCFLEAHPGPTNQTTHLRAERISLAVSMSTWNNTRKSRENLSSCVDEHLDRLGFQAMAWTLDGPECRGPGAGRHRRRVSRVRARELGALPPSA